MSRPTYLFVYGTLLREHAPREISNAVRRLKPIGTAKMGGKLYDFGEYPGAVAAPGRAGKISGRLFEVPDSALLKEIDEYEGYNPARPARSLFLRKKRFVTLSNGRRLLSWVYLFNGAPKDGRLLAHGSYSKYKNRNGRTDVIRKKVTV